ncbi:MAG: hypothetical protein AAGH53_05615 [Pseudomonadota bacterium]
MLPRKSIQKSCEAKATERTQGGDPAALDNQWQVIRNEVYALEALLNGNKARNEINERTQAIVGSRLGAIITGLFTSTHGPTQTHRDQFGYAKGEFDAIRNRLNTLTKARSRPFRRSYWLLVRHGFRVASCLDFGGIQLGSVLRLLPKQHLYYLMANCVGSSHLPKANRVERKTIQHSQVLVFL